MAEPQPFIVGRQSEVDRFAALINGRTAHWLLNIYGPGGIGKTVVGQKLLAYAHQHQIPATFIDGIRPGLTPDGILYAIHEGLAETEAFATFFRGFEQEFQLYQFVQRALQQGGGMNTLFDVAGSVKEPATLAQLTGSIDRPVATQAEPILSNRFALERYLRGVERTLTHSLAASLEAVAAEAPQSPAVLIDTYEEMEGLDDWVCGTLAPALPPGIKVVVLGRNALPRVNFDWQEFGPALHAMELPELSEEEAKAYLVHHGLQDRVVLNEVYRFTGGYPLLLVLVVYLSREAGGWRNIGTLDSAADRDHIASELLKRILREERVKEVQAFLEKGVVARWFTPEVVSVILEMSPEEGRAVYDQLRRHSFVERHPFGLKFHDKIRELLLERLKFNKPEHQALVSRLQHYYAQKAGVQERGEAAGDSPASKYIIHIHDSANIVIGDQAEVSQTTDEP